MLRLRFIIAAAAIATTLFTTGALALAGGKKRTATFKVRVENVSDKDGLATSDGAKYPFALSPGLYAVTEGKLELFNVGKKAIAGLEAQAEDGDPEMLYSVIQGKRLAGSYGLFNKPIGAEAPGPLLPGGVYEFTFNAAQGMKLNLIAMYGQSNDLFYGPQQAIDLFDANGKAITGDITDKFLLWDAGTEVNQAPGLGADQGARQKAQTWALLKTASFDS